MLGQEGQTSRNIFREKAADIRRGFKWRENTLLNNAFLGGAVTVAVLFAGGTVKSLAFDKALTAVDYFFMFGCNAATIFAVVAWALDAGEYQRKAENLSVFLEQNNLTLD